MALNVANHALVAVDLGVGLGTLGVAERALRSSVASPVARLAAAGAIGWVAMNAAHWFMLRNQHTLFADPMFARTLP